MFSMKFVSLSPLIATFQLLSAACLNLGWSQNGIRDWDKYSFRSDEIQTSWVLIVTELGQTM